MGHTQRPEGVGQMRSHHDIPRPTNCIKGGTAMDPSAITTFVQTLGFPIACVVYLFYAQQKEREAHAEESKGWIEAIHNNTLAITQLTDIIKALKDGQ